MTKHLKAINEALKAFNAEALYEAGSVEYDASADIHVNGEETGLSFQFARGGGIGLSLIEEQPEWTMQYLYAGRDIQAAIAAAVAHLSR